MNMFARFDKKSTMTLYDIKETKRYELTHAQMDGKIDVQRENSIPTTNYNNVSVNPTKAHISLRICPV